MDMRTEDLIKVILDDYPHKGRIVINGDASAGNRAWVCVFSFSTTLTATEPNTETSMAVTSGTGTANGDIIGVMLDSGSIHWTTISSGGGTTTIVLTSGLTGQATSGNRVYVFRWKSYGTIA